MRVVCMDKCRGEEVTGVFTDLYNSGINARLGVMPDKVRCRRGISPYSQVLYSMYSASTLLD